jgi:hypothetical protein
MNISIMIRNYNPISWSLEVVIEYDCDGRTSMLSFDSWHSLLLHMGDLLPLTVCPIYIHKIGA